MGVENNLISISMSINVSKILLYTTHTNDRNLYNKFHMSSDNVYFGLTEFAFWAYDHISIECISIWAIIDIETWKSSHLKPTDYTREDIPKELISDCAEYNRFIFNIIAKIESLKSKPAIENSK